ncbi:hypothetical protein KUTeg_017517, partial [Tegillarca granosa]
MANCISDFDSFWNLSEIFITVFVLAQQHIRRTSTAVYLTVLALTDITVLNTGLMRHWIIKMFSWDIRHYSNVGCKLHLLLSYFSPDFSSWILVTVTIERVLMVWCPYWTRNKCSKKISALVVIIIAIFLLIYNCHMLYGVGDFKYMEDNKTVFKKCDFTSKTYDAFFAKTWPLMDLAVYSLVPFLFLLVGNFLIIKKVLISRKRSRRCHVTAIKQRVSYNFYPYFSLLDWIRALAGRSFIKGTSHFRAMWAIVNQLMYVNSAVNFILYCITGSRFRQEAKTLLC